MALPFTPDSATVYPMSQTVNPTSKAVEVPRKGATGTPVPGYLEPASGSNAAGFEPLVVDMDKPHFYYCEITDAALFKINAYVEINGRKFQVHADPKLLTGPTMLGLDHAIVLLEEKQMGN